MRLIVRHDTTYVYEEPARFVIQRLLLTPRHCASQHIMRWRVEVDHDCRLHDREDAFGNLAQSMSVDGPVASITTSVEGEVETFDTNGVIKDAVERLPPDLYLRETAMTTADEPVRDFSADIAAKFADRIERLHALNSAIHKRMAFDVDATSAGTNAADAFARKRGVCQDFANIFCAAARRFGAPARYVSGYFRRDDGHDAQVAGHAWAEAFVPFLGWVGFDPAHDVSPGEAYVRVAIGLDSLDAAPVRGSRIGGGAEKLKVNVRAEAAQSQSQS